MIQLPHYSIVLVFVRCKLHPARKDFGTYLDYNKNCGAQTTVPLQTSYLVPSDLMLELE